MTPWCYRVGVADVLNLNHARKRKQRQEARGRADANAIKHGRSKAQRDADRAGKALLDARLDGARLDADPEDERSDADDS